jgi:hypothetical protein
VHILVKSHCSSVPGLCMQCSSTLPGSCSTQSWIVGCKFKVSLSLKRATGTTQVRHALCLCHISLAHASQCYDATVALHLHSRSSVMLPLLHCIVTRISVLDYRCFASLHMHLCAILPMPLFICPCRPVPADTARCGNLRHTVHTCKDRAQDTDATLCLQANMLLSHTAICYHRVAFANLVSCITLL